MATSEDVDHFIRTYAPTLESALEVETKDNLHALIERYESSGYSKEQLAEVIEERVPQTTLADASKDDFVEVVTELVAPSETGHAADGQQSAEPTRDEVIADLANALAHDAHEEIAATKTAFFEYLTKHLWAEVSAEVLAEVEATDATWDSVEEAKAAAYEPAYNALIAAMDGLWEEGDAAGGFADLLSRPQS
jgi:hypothetical protein